MKKLVDIGSKQPHGMEPNFVHQLKTHISFFHFPYSQSSTKKPWTMIQLLVNQIIGIVNDPALRYNTNLYCRGSFTLTSFVAGSADQKTPPPPFR